VSRGDVCARVCQVYWPPPYGIIRTKFDHWVQLAQNASFMVSVLPLSPEWSAKFDEVR
jgi:hypothetical protein